MLHIHEGRGLDAALLLEKARKKQRDLDEIACLAYKAYLEGKGEEAADIYTAWIFGDIDKEEALSRLKQLVARG